MIRFFATAAITAVLAFAGAASASDYRISLRGLDLATPQGAATFDLRVRRAGLAACVSGSSLDQVRCRRDFRTEAHALLPAALRQDYARARSERIVVRTSSEAR